MPRARRTTPARHMPEKKTVEPEGRITAEQVMQVSRSAQPHKVHGTDHTLTIDELMKLTVRGDWESGYYQLTTPGAARAARAINTKLQAEKVPATSS